MDQLPFNPSVVAITGGTIVGVTLSGCTYLGGTISGSTLVGVTLSGSTFIGGSISGSTITSAGGALSGTTFNAPIISGGTIAGATLSGCTYIGGTLSGTTLGGVTLSVSTFIGGSISGSTITSAGGALSGTTFNAPIISGGTIAGATLSGCTYIGGTLSGTTLGGVTLSGAVGVGTTTISGNFSHVGSGTFGTGTGAVAINGVATFNGNSIWSNQYKMALGSVNSAAAFNINSAVTATSGGGVNQYGILDLFTGQSDATSIVCSGAFGPTTAAAAFTATALVSLWANFTAPALGAGSAATRTAGLAVQSRTVGGTANHGIYYGSAASIAGSGNWCIYNNTADPVYLGTGAVLLNTTTDDAVNKLQVNGGARSLSTTDSTSPTTGAIISDGGIGFGVTKSLFGGGIKSTSPTLGIGYATGAGGTVTQITSRTTGVTINTVCGSITLVSAAGSTSYQTFTVTNSTVAATDTIRVNQKSGTDLNIILVTAVAAGSFNISFATTGGTTTEQPVFNFAVLKAVAA